MIAYVQQLAEDLSQRLGDEEFGLDFTSRFEVLAEELDRLDPRDFAASAQYRFVDSRRLVRKCAFVSQAEWRLFAEAANPIDPNRDYLIPLRMIAEQVEFPRNDIDHELRPGRSAERAAWLLSRHVQELCQRVSKLVTEYAGAGSHSETRSFAFVANAELRAIVERDYKELSLSLYPGRAWKSTVVMAGSILEAILYDQLTRDAGRRVSAMAAIAAPPRKGGGKRDISVNAGDDEWNLKSLIAVSLELGIVEPADDKVIHQVLRDYRNFIHPAKEIRDDRQLTEAKAMLAKGALDDVCDHLEKPVPLAPPPAVLPSGGTGS